MSMATAELPAAPLQRKSLSPKGKELKAEGFTIKAYTKNAKVLEQ